MFCYLWLSVGTTSKGNADFLKANVLDLLEDEQGLSMGVCWRSISVNQQHLLHFSLSFEL
jgi:hypothetical protein